MQNITEEMKVHEEWYKEAHADGMSLAKLPAFLKKLTEDYNHDYGTICHALTAGAIATMWAMNRTKQGGITGFQSGCIMWEFMKQWNHIEAPARLVEYKNMLYPQYEDKFQKVISQSTWNFLKTEAQKNLDEKSGSDNCRRHWQSIVDGVIPFGYSIKETD